MGHKEVAAAAQKAAGATPEAAAAAIQEATKKAPKALGKRPASSAKGECGAPATTSFRKRPRKQGRLRQEKQQPEQQPPRADGVHRQEDEHGNKKRRRQQQQQHQVHQDRNQTTDMGKGEGAASDSLGQSEKTETAAGAPPEDSPSAENDAAADAADSAAAIDAAAAADPYLLEDAEYLRRETRWLNRQRVLVLGSRGISARSRHLIEDLKKLLPHHKSEASLRLELHPQNPGLG